MAESQDKGQEDDILNMNFNTLPDFRESARRETSAKSPRQVRQDRQVYKINPDEHGCIYMISGLCGVTLDCCSERKQAEYAVHQHIHRWNFAQIWQLNVKDQTRQLIYQQETRQINPIEMSQLRKTHEHK